MKRILIIALLIVAVFIASMLIWLGPFPIWRSFVDFSNSWGNVASVLGLIITLVGFALTACGFVFIQGRIRRAVERVGLHILSTAANEVEVVLEEFKLQVRQQHWLRACEKCDDAVSRMGRMQGNPNLTAEEAQRIATGIDDLRVVSKYIMRNKLKPNSPATFQPERLDMIDRVLDNMRAIQIRQRTQMWEV